MMSAVWRHLCPIEKYFKKSRITHLFYFIYISRFKPNTEKYSFHQATQKRHRNNTIERLLYNQRRRGYNSILHVKELSSLI